MYARLLVSIGAVAAARTAARAEAPRFEASGFVGVDYFGDDIELGNSWASEQIPGTAMLAGARLGWVAARDLAPGERVDPQIVLEAEARLAAAFTGGVIDGDGRMSYFAPVFGWRGHVLFRMGALGPLAPHFVLGLGGETVASTSPFMQDDTDFAAYYGLGATWQASPRWAVRLDGRHGLTAGRVDPVTSTFEVHLGLGTQWSWSPTAPPPRPPRLADADADGMPDVDDECPGAAESRNGFEDDDGCPDVADRDGDGQADEVDRCPSDAEVVNGIDDDDGCPDVDDDHDGVLGSRDACPDAAEDLDRYADDDGCPDPDNDGDGIGDHADACVGDPEVVNGIDDGDGCPDSLPAKVVALEGPMRGVTFPAGKARLAPAAVRALAAVAAVLRQHPGLRVRLAGVVAAVDEAPARDLATRRAEAVKWALVDRGIAADRLETAGRAEPQGKDRVELAVVTGAPTSAPATQPSAPATQPSAPTTQPSAPATQPSAPATQPSAPAR
ncbi:MAG: OmpA family protein [Kofleriaceae bacterium]|nr:OmpA family protein [Kofleriaceae bacterium]